MFNLRATLTTILTSIVLGLSYILATGLETPEPIGPFLDEQLPASLPVSFELLESEGTAITALAMAAEPRGERLFVAEQSGTIYTFLPGTGGLTNKTFFLDLTQRVWAGQDSGVLGLAFHPEYNQAGSPNSSYFYVYYTTDKGGTQYLRLSRFSGITQGDQNSEEILIEQRLGVPLHRGGGLLFGEDGFLYLAIGELGWPEDAQEITGRLVGGVIRIDVDKRGGAVSHPPRRTLEDVGEGTSGNGYYIPSDNPFLDEEGGVFEEYYSIGARNPHRMTIDRVTGKIYIGNVGSNSGDKREEINLLVKGGNYGWPFREGTIDRSDLMPRPATILGTLQDPIHEYQHTSGDGCSVIGGYVYRGSEIPELYGKYILGDYCSNKIWSLDIDGLPGATKEELAVTALKPATFGEDHHGELYIGGTGVQPVLKLAAAVADNFDGITVPSLLSETGAFTDLISLTPASGVIPYDIIAPLWSDGAEKYRWVAIPNDGTHDTPGEQVVFSDSSEWEFPVGTVFIKHFEIALDERTPSDTRSLETRFLVRQEDGRYYALTYKWNDQGTDAELLDGSLSEPLIITNSDGTTRQQNWDFPGRSDCFACHTQAAGFVLGPKTRQLNGDLFYTQTGITANQIESWNHIGLFDQEIDPANLPDLLTSKNIKDESAPLEDRVRSYLDANCASCHRPDGGPRTSFDLRLQTPLLESGLIKGEVLEDFGIEGAKLIVPGYPEKSVLYKRISELGTGTAMPPLAKNKLDEEAIALIREWIHYLLDMPVELVAFHGLIDGSQAFLTWETRSETNNAGFSIERSIQSVGNDEEHEWNEVGFIKGQGTITIPHTYTFTDNVPPDTRGDIYYRLKQIDFDGGVSYSDIVSLEAMNPASANLYDNYPDPFNPKTTISFDIPVVSHVKLQVFDLQGRMVRELINEEHQAGRFEVAFDATNLASGTYLYRLQAGEKVVTKSMILLK